MYKLISMTRTVENRQVPQWGGRIQYRQLACSQVSAHRYKHSHSCSCALIWDEVQHEHSYQTETLAASNTRETVYLQWNNIHANFIQLKPNKLNGRCFFTHNPTRWTKTIDSESVYIPTELKNQSTYQQKIFTAPNILCHYHRKKRVKKVVGNSQGGGCNILGHFKHHFESQISSEWFKQVYI